jgi:hypothetical protein
MNLLPRMSRIAELHRDRAAATGIALLAAWVFVILADVVGRMSLLGLLAIILASLAVFASSDSYAGLLLLGAMVLQWVTSGLNATTWWAIPAAWLLLIAHVAVTLAASGPDQAPIPPPVRALWCARSAVVGAVTTLVGVLALLIEPAGNGFPRYAGPAAVLVLVVAVLWLIRFADESDNETSGTSR